MAWAIELRDAWKAFVLRHNPAYNLKDRVIGLFDPRRRERVEQFWALRAVDLAVQAGECVGLIGPNGSGKSTLLRVIANIIPPTRGDVTVRGRVAPMIELGVGFHPDLTGRENVFLNTSLHGLSRRETEALYRRIVEFSELDDFIDVPVKNFSTGMYLRLGFSVAAHLEPDVLLIDEVLAVGDEHFQRKCLRRMEDLRRRGTTLIVVSHNMETIAQMCNRGCLLVEGRIEVDGEPAEAIERYREVLSAGSAPSAARDV